MFEPHSMYRDCSGVLLTLPVCIRPRNRLVVPVSHPVHQECAGVVVDLQGAQWRLLLDTFHQPSCIQCYQSGSTTPAYRGAASGQPSISGTDKLHG